eukprot:1157240-Pelagomonas_calceolata.AAC.1
MALAAGFSRNLSHTLTPPHSRRAAPASSSFPRSSRGVMVQAAKEGGGAQKQESRRKEQGGKSTSEPASPLDLGPIGMTFSSQGGDRNVGCLDFEGTQCLHDSTLACKDPQLSLPAPLTGKEQPKDGGCKPSGFGAHWNDLWSQYIRAAGYRGGCAAATVAKHQQDDHRRMAGQVRERWDCRPVA